MESKRGETSPRNCGLEDPTYEVRTVDRSAGRGGEDVVGVAAVAASEPLPAERRAERLRDSDRANAVRRLRPLHGSGAANASTYLQHARIEAEVAPAQAPQFALSCTARD